MHHFNYPKSYAVLFGSKDCSRNFYREYSFEKLGLANPGRQSLVQKTSISIVAKLWSAAKTFPK